jgi:SAM-dependent methyltransferase
VSVAVHDNLALTSTWLSPVTRRPLAWDAGRSVFAGADGETFSCLADEIPDFRPGERPLPAEEVTAIRARLGRLWDEGTASAAPPAAISPATPAAARRYWRRTARAEAVAFAVWLVRGRPAYTQRDSMQLYRSVTDVYPSALRRQVTVLVDGQPATAPLALFKRLSLQPVIDLIRREAVRSILDFGCGWGVNTIILRQLFPELDIWSFDYSPQRVLSTQFNLRALGLRPYRLFTADGSRLPLVDGAVDLVLSSHVLEQMAEVLPAALRETFRVARRFACHVEPTYRFARWPHRLRVRRLGYPRDVATAATAAGWRLLERRLASPAWGRTPGELLVLEKPRP